MEVVLQLLDHTDVQEGTGRNGAEYSGGERVVAGEGPANQHGQSVEAGMKENVNLCSLLWHVYVPIDVAQRQSFCPFVDEYSDK